MEIRTKKKYEKTLIKVSLALMIISIIILIIFSFVKSQTTANHITGKATKNKRIGPTPNYNPSQNPFNTIIGNVSYNSSFKINIGYDYAARWQTLYDFIKKDIITTCESNKNLENCVEKGMEQKLPKKHFSIISQQDNPYYDFIDNYTQCIESSSNNCVCPYDPQKTSQSQFLIYFLNSRTYFAKQKNSKLTQMYNSSHYDFPDQVSLSEKEVISSAPKISMSYNGIMVNQNKLNQIKITATGNNPNILSNKEYTKLYSEKGSTDMFLFYKYNNKLYLTKKFEDNNNDYAKTLFQNLKTDIETNCFPTPFSPSEFPLNGVSCNAKKFCDSLLKENFANLDIFSALCNTPVSLCNLATCSQITLPTGITLYFFTWDDTKVEQFINSHLPSKTSLNVYSNFVSSLNELKKNKCTLVKHRYEYVINDTSLKEPLLYYNYTTGKYEQEYPVFHIAFYVPITS